MVQRTLEEVQISGNVSAPPQEKVKDRVKRTLGSMNTLEDRLENENVSVSKEVIRMGGFVSEEQKVEFRRKGKIGFWEALWRKDSDVVTIVAELLTAGQSGRELGMIASFEDKAAMKRWKANEYGKFREGATSVEGLLAAVPTEALQKLRKDDPTLPSFEELKRAQTAPLGLPGVAEKETGFRQKIEDRQRIQKFFEKRTEESEREFDTLGEIGAGTAELVDFAAWFLATGGVGTLVKTGTEKGIAKLIGASTEKGLTKFMTKTVGLATATGARIAIAPNLLAENFANRQINAGLELTDKGLRMTKGISESPATSWGLALTDTFITVFSEGVGDALIIAGGAVVKGIKAVSGKITSKFVKEIAKKTPNHIPVPFVTAFSKAFAIVNPETPILQFFKKGGYNGFLAELGEERVDGLLKAITGIEDFGAEDPGSTFDRIVSSWPSWHELMVEAGVIAFPTGLNMGVQTMVKRTKERKKEQGIKELAKLTELSVEEVRTIVEEVAVEKEIPKKKVTEAVPEKEVPEKEKVTEVVPEKEVAEPVKEKPVEVEPEEVKPKVEPIETPEQRLVAEGRITKLEAENKTTLKEIKALERKRDQLEKESEELEDVKAAALRIERAAKVDDQIRKLDAKLAQAEREIDAIEDSILEPKARERIITTAGKVLKTVAKRVEAATRLSAVEARQEVKKIQKEIRDFLKASELSKEDIGKFLTPLIQTQTLAQLQKNLPKIEQKIAALVEKSAVKRLRASIEKTLAKTKPKKRAGKPVGRFTPEIQKVLDLIRETTKKSRIAAESEITANLEKLEGKIPSAEVALENAILGTASDIGTRSADELRDLKERIQLLIKTGRAEALIKQANLKERRQKQVADVVSTLQGDKPVKATDKPSKKGIAKALRNFLSGGKSINGWADLMDILSQDDPTSKAFESRLSEIAEVSTIEQKEKGDTLTDGQVIVNLMKDAFGFKRNRQATRQIRRDTKKKDLGIFTDRSGQEVRLNLSIAERRKIWMEFQDPLIRESIEVEEGGYRLGDININGLTQQMQDAIFEELDTSQKEFALAQMDFYRELRKKRINIQYRKDFGVDLPFNEFYSPISRVVGKEEIADTFLKEQNFRRSIDPTFTKSRVINREKIVVQSDLQVLQRHIIEMNHYLNWSDKLKDLNNIFGNSNVRRIIKSKFGDGMLSIVNKFLLDFQNKGLQKIQLHERPLGLLRRNFTIAALALKPALTIKQLMSFPAYAEFVPIKDFLIGMKDFAKSPLETAKILMNTNLMKTRGSSLTRDIQDALGAKGLAVFQANPTIKNYLLITTRIGDAGAILFGGGAVYHAVLKKTGSKEMAIKAFEKATASTQQSADISQLSAWQRGGEFAKLFTMFTSAQNQYLRRELGAIRNLLKGRLPAKEFAKKIAIYHFVLPMMFQLASDFGEWDEEEQIRAMILGPLNGYFILGDILDWTVREALNIGADFELPVHQIQFGPITDSVKGLYKAGAALDQEEILLEDVLIAVEELSSRTIGPMLGLPVKRILDSYEGINDIIEEEDVKRGVLKLAGWSPYIVNRQLDKEEE